MISEIELAKQVIQWLVDQHWEVYQEVQFRCGGGVADIVAVRNNITWIIETKTTLSLTVLEQASRWNSIFRSAAVPAAFKKDNRSLAYRIAHDYLQIGIIEVPVNSTYDVVTEVICPPIQRQNYRFSKNYYLPELLEEHKTYALAGNNSGSRFTPYRRTIDSVRRFIEKHPGCSIKEIMTNIGETHYSSAATAKSCIFSALQTFESDWCEAVVENGRYKFYVKEK
jgi:hypothetical protein